MARYVIEPGVVQDAISKLIEGPVHRMFPGYLALKQQSAIHGRTDNLPFPYTDFFEQYFRVAEEEKPYFVPFSPSENPSEEQLWVGTQVAGTYAPSSIRRGSPFTKVVKIEDGGHNSRWRLKPDHWNLAKHHLCEGESISAEALAAFIYRDYAFETTDPSAFMLLEAFVDDFGYEISDKEFTTLYHTGDTNIGADSFERYD